MILQDNQNDVYTRGIDKTETFKFTNSPVIFKILSDSLYSDKISSIVRELSSNAHDSHVAAGKKDISFDIHLPIYNNKSLFNDEKEMYFSVKDYGTGLSEEEIYNLYTIYGESNKRQSNEYIGGFGIGSKSPFAYTDCFTVISRYDGRKTTYSAFVNENGYPSITKIYEEATDECNGVEISFPVKESDVEKFVIAVNRELKFFEPYPNVNNEKCTPFVKENISNEGDGWFIERYTYGRPSLYFIIGNVQYRVDSEYYNKFWNGTMFVTCEVGSLSLAASRETLAYTNTTKKIITDKLDAIQKEIISRIVEYKKTHTQYEYLLYINHLPYTYKNFNEDFYNGYDVIHDYTKNIVLPYKKFINFLTLHKSDIHIYNYGKLRKFDKVDENLYIEISNNTKFVYFTKKYYLKDISSYIWNRNEFHNKTVVAIRYSDKNSISDINDKFYNPSYNLVDKFVKEESDNVVKTYKVNFRSVSSLYYNRMDSPFGTSIIDTIEHTVKYMKDKIVLLYERGNFVGNYDWTSEQRTNFSIKFMRMYNIFSNRNKKNETEIILLNKKSYDILKKYGVKIFTYQECHERMKRVAIDYLKLTEELYSYTSIYSNYVSSMVKYITNNFTHDEIIRYKDKNILFDLVEKLWPIVSDYESEYVFHMFSAIKLVDKNEVNKYNNYILEEPILRLLCNNYVEKSVKSCLVKYLNLN